MTDRCISRTDRQVRWIVVGFVALVLALGSAEQVRANLILDPGFELSPAPGLSANWTTSPAIGSQITVGNLAASAHTGNQFASFNNPLPTGTLSQSFATVIGQQYRLDFWLRSSVATNDFTAKFGTNPVHTVSPPIGNPYHLFEFFEIAASTTTTLSFQGLDGTITGEGGFFRLDDVSVDAVPEPASLTLLGLGLVGLIGYQWRRRQRAITR